MVRFIFTLLFCSLLSAAFSQQNFKNIGYLPYYRFSWINKIEFNRLTHVNIAFANPDAQGNLSCGGVSITNAVNKAKQAGCKVFISLAGGYLTPEQETNWNSLMSAANRAGFIQKIIQYLQTNNLDGVDLDLEWQYVNNLYSPFVIELSAALKQKGYPFTAALPGNHKYPQITNEALGKFDWINMMIYDLRGPWDPGNPGQHSPYSWAVDCINYWIGKGVPATKLTLGVPFYGYDFAKDPVAPYTYRYIVSLDPANAWVDQFDQTWYNGIPTIQQKTQLALNKVAGIMIWELGGDAFDADAPLSLLKAIDEVIHPATDTDSPLAASTLRIYPNPATDWIVVPLVAAAHLRISDLQGNMVYETDATEADAFKIYLPDLAPGMYVVQSSGETGISVGRFIKAAY